MLVCRTASARETIVGPGGALRTACRATSSQRMAALSVETRTVEHAPSARTSVAKLAERSSARGTQRPARIDPASRMLRVMGKKSVALVLAAVAILVAIGCATDRPPAQPGSLHESRLVEISRLEPGVHLDIRYATAD